MKAAVVDFPGKLVVRDMPDPVCPEDGVVIRVRATTICPSDLKRSFKTDLPQPRPYILGHEMAGTLSAVGKKVAGWKEGERVGFAPRIFCGRCRPCLAGHTNLCKNTLGPGWHFPGSFAELLGVPGGTGVTDAMVRLPADLSFEAASLAEPLACALNGIEMAGVGPNDTVVVIGMGCQGVMQAQIAKRMGARKVIGVMRSGKRSGIVRQCAPSLDELAVSADVSPRDIVNKHTGGEGASVVLVSASSGEALALALELVCFRGRICIHASIPAGEEILKADANRIHYEEITFTGSSSFKQRQYVEALKLMREGVVDSGKLIGARLPLSEIEKGISLMNNREALKVAIIP